MLGKTRHVHFVGIGGIGMSGIAELLANLGYVVSGSDEKQSPVTDRLASLGVRVAYGHAEENVRDAEVGMHVWSAVVSRRTLPAKLNRTSFIDCRHAPMLGERVRNDTKEHAAS